MDIEKDKEHLETIKEVFDTDDWCLEDQDTEWLIETLKTYICRYDRLKTAVNESMTTAAITNTRLKIVQKDSFDDK